MAAGCRNPHGDSATQWRERSSASSSNGSSLAQARRRIRIRSRRCSPCATARRRCGSARARIVTAGQSLIVPAGASTAFAIRARRAAPSCRAGLAGLRGMMEGATEVQRLGGGGLERIVRSIPVIRTCPCRPSRGCRTLFQHGAEGAFEWRQQQRPTSAAACLRLTWRTTARPSNSAFTELLPLHQPL